MPRIQQPNTHIKLTNVAFVRLRKGGKRFEIACYKNKVLEWRNGIETDMDEVLQIHQVYMNVSKGQAASKEDLLKCFKTEDEAAIIQEILKKGEVQISEKERDHIQQTTHLSIAQFISSSCVNPATKRPYPVSMIEKAMEELHTSINPNKSAKVQSLEIIKQIQEKNIIALQRAQMRVRLAVPVKDAKKIREKVISAVSKVEEEDFGSTEFEMVCLIDPGQYRTITDIMQEDTKGHGQLEILSLREVKEDDEKFE